MGVKMIKLSKQSREKNMKTIEFIVDWNSWYIDNFYGSTKKRHRE